MRAVAGLSLRDNGAVQHFCERSLMEPFEEDTCRRCVGGASFPAELFSIESLLLLIESLLLVLNRRARVVNFETGSGIRVVSTIASVALILSGDASRIEKRRGRRLSRWRCGPELGCGLVSSFLWSRERSRSPEASDRSRPNAWACWRRCASASTLCFWAI